MKSCPGCAAWIPGDAPVCPSCGASAVGAAPAGGAPPPSAPPPVPLSAFDRAAVVARIRALGVLHVVYGSLLLVSVALSFWDVASGEAARSLEAARAKVPPEFREFAAMFIELALHPVLQFLGHAIPFALAVLCLHAGTRLRALRGRSLGIGAAVAILVLAPCEGQNCCCLLGIPLAIHSLLVLTDGRAEAVLAERA